MREVAEVLRKARDLYATNPSHAPEGTMCEGESVCAVLAIRYAAPGDDTAQTEALKPLVAAAGVAVPRMWEYPRELIQWNAERSTDDVVAAFDRAVEATS